MYPVPIPLIGVSGINEKFNIGIFYDTKDNFYCIFIAQSFIPKASFLFNIREKNFTLTPF